MAIKDYSTNPDMNTTISGINIAEGCAPSGINNAIRQLMADVKAESEATQATQATQAAKDAAQDTAINVAQSGVSEAKQSVTTLDKTLRALIAQEVAKCLLKTGGTMKGGIVFDGVSNCISAVGNNPNPIRIMSGSDPYGDGSFITLLPVDYEDPDFASTLWFRTCLGGVNKSWYFFPDGRLQSPGTLFYAFQPVSSAKVGQWVHLTAMRDSPLALPSGGTWAYYAHWMADANGKVPETFVLAGVAAGGTQIFWANAQYKSQGFAWRIA